MEEKLYKNVDWLKQQKIKYGSGKAIARETGYAETCIHRYLKKYGLNDTPTDKPYHHKEWLIHQYKLGKEIKEIAKEIKCSTASITLANRKFGMSVTDYNPKYKYKDQKWLTKQFELYGSVSNVAQKTGYPRTSITRYAIKYGLYEKNYTRVQRINVNEEYFKVIDTAEKAYWLGFIVADGNVYKFKSGILQFSLKIKSQDRGHIEKFADAIDFDGTLDDVLNVRNNKINQGSAIKFSNKNFCKYLIELGVVPRKTGKEKLPSEVPNKFIRDFIRGFIDGDGWVYNNKHRFTLGFCSASSSVVEDCKIYLEALVGTLPKTLESKNMYRMSATKKVQVYRMVKHLYYKDCVSLDRKNKIARGIINQYEENFL